MNRIDILISGIIILSFIAGCGSDKATTSPQAELRFYKDFVHFDTTEFVRINIQDGTNSYEPILNCDKSLGEPFIDLNGDGNYTAGVDSFVISPDPAINMDLNRNGHYDGPDVPWAPGMPYEDLNGNAVFDACTGDDSSGYKSGVLYCDLNGNGVRDSSIIGLYSIVKWSRNNSNTEGAYFSQTSNTRPFSTYRYRSITGKFYSLGVNNPSGISNVILSDSGLYRWEYVVDPGPVQGAYMVQILDTGAITEEFNVMRGFQYNYHLFQYTRNVRFDTSIFIDGRTYSNLLMVNLKFSDHTSTFFFSKARGLVGYQYDALTLSEKSVIQGDYSSFIIEPIIGNDSLIFEMSR